MTTPSVSAPTLPVIEDAAKRKRESRYVLWILALYSCIAIPLALWLNVWIDESYSYFATSRELSYIIPHCRYFQLQPPAFFLLLWFWRRISMAVWFARLLPVALVGLTLYLAHLTTRKWFPSISSAWVVLPLAFNPWVFYAGTEVRSYCLILLCTTVFLYLFPDAFLAEKRSRRAQLLYLLAAIVALHTFYFLGFPLAGGGVALVLGRRWRAVRDYAVLMSVAAIAVIPQLRLALEHERVITEDITNLPNLARATVYTIGRVVSMEVDYFNFDQRIRMFWFALLIGGLFSLAVVRWRNWTFQRSVIPIITSIVVALYIALSWKISGEESFHRHFLIALVPLHFSIVAIVDNLGVARSRVLRMVMLTLTAAGLVSSSIRFAPLAKAGDYRRVAQYIEQNESNDGLIAMITSHTEYPFLFYYRGKNKIVPLPAHDPLERYRFAAWALQSTDEVREKFSSIQSGGHIWVYADRPPNAQFHGVHLGYELLEQVLAEDYTLLDERDFYKAKLRQFEKK